MASEAILVCHPLVVEHFPHFVRLVAIHTRRQHVGFTLPQLPFDHLPVHGFDLRMTLRAGRRDVLARNG